MPKDTEPKQYEMSYLIDGRLEKQRAEEFADKIRGLLDTSRNIIIEQMPVKLQRLAYPVKRQTEAFGGWLKFMANPGELAGIKLKIERMSEVLRLLIASATREDAPRRLTVPSSKKKMVTKEEAVRTEEIDKKLEEILGA